MMAKQIESIAMSNEISQNRRSFSINGESTTFFNMTRAYLALTLMIIGSSTLGCGSGNPYALVPIEGKITYEDGTPIPNLQLSFKSTEPPLDGKTYPRPTTTTIADDGTIEYATTNVYGDGIIAGEHKVIVQSRNAKMAITKDVPIKYGKEQTTPLTVNTAEMPFNILIEKP